MCCSQLLEKMRNEYEEYIQITKIEYESFKTQHLEDYKSLNQRFEATKTRLFEERKKMGLEYEVLEPLACILFPHLIQNVN